MQVQRHGLWPTLRRLFVTGFQRGGEQQRQQQDRPAGGQARSQSRKERFERVAKAVQALPMEEYVTRADLERCSLHDLRVRTCVTLRSAGIFVCHHATLGTDACMACAMGAN